jgi:methylglutaconyl-CoA hydratase
MTLHITHNGPITTVTLDRPDVHNAFDAAMIAEIRAAFDAPRQRRTRACHCPDRLR